MNAAPHKTVLLAIGYHDRLNGAQLCLLEIARNLPALGYRPILVTVGEGRATEAFRRAGIEVRVLRAPAEFNRFNKQWLRRGALRRPRALATGIPQLTLAVYRLIRAENVALVHVNEPRALLLFGWGAKLARRPVILHARGSMRGVYPTLLWELIQRLPRLIIRDGDAIKADMRPTLRSKIRVVYEAPYSHTVEAAVAAPSDGAPTVVTVASYIPYKGYHHLLEAVPLINEAVGAHAVRFRWFGQTLDEAYARTLRSRIETLGLPNVELGDWTSEIDAVLRRAAVYVQPTVDHETIEVDGEMQEIWSAEGIPHSVLEALARGVPVVASAVGSMSEAVVHGTTGMLVPAGDPAALAGAITALLRNPSERARLGREGIQMIDRRFTLASCTNGVVNVYAELAPMARS